MEKTSKNFGNKEHVLNYACQLFQLSRPPKVGAVMELIRKCQPSSLKEWEDWYFENAYTDKKDPKKATKVTIETIEELGERLYYKIKNVVIPQWEEAFQKLTLQDCIDYVYNVTINRTFDGYMREKSVVNDNLAKIFKDVIFEESDPHLDHAGDIDYIAKVGSLQFGLQIKPITANANFGGYSLSERMKASFDEFTEEYGARSLLYTAKKERSPTLRSLSKLELKSLV